MSHLQDACRGCTDRQAPDGTRADKDGKRWYPPSGNGILAASKGIYPRKGSVVSGDVTTNPEEGIKVSAPDEGEEVPGLAPVDAKEGEPETKESDIEKKEDATVAASESWNTVPRLESINLTRYSQRDEVWRYYTRSQR